MKKLLSAILSIGIFLGCMPGNIIAAKLESGVTSAVFGENDFYVKQDQNRVYWGGGFTATEKPDDEAYQLLIGLYDNERLVSVDSMQIDEVLDSYIFEEQCINLSYEPENLTAKAFAWSNDGMMMPLSEAVDAKNVEFNTYYVKGRITEIDELNQMVEFSVEYSENFDGQIVDTLPLAITARYTDEAILDNLLLLMDAKIGVDEAGNYVIKDFKVINESISIFSLRAASLSLGSLENNIKVIAGDESIIISGDVNVTVSGSGTYDMVLCVKDGENEIFTDTITLDSRIKEFTVNAIYDIVPSDTISVDIDFKYNAENLTETKNIGITDSFMTLTGHVTKVYMGTDETYLNHVIFQTTDGEEFTVDAGNTDITERTFEKIVLNVEEKNGDYKAISYEPWQGNEVVTYESKHLESFDKNNLTFYADNTLDETVSYEISDDTKLYVNGTRYRYIEDGLYMYAFDNPATSIKLVNTPKAGEAPDTVIDYIVLDVWATVTVDEVVVSDNENVDIYLAEFGNFFENSVIRFSQSEISSGNQKYTLKDTTGENIELSDLKSGDVLTVYADFCGDDLEYPENIKMVLSRDTVSGMVMKENADNTYMIGDKDYEFAIYPQDLTVGDEYILYLDMFGRIAKFAYDPTNINYGIINRVWEDSNGELNIRLTDKFGQIVTYTFKSEYEYTDWKYRYDSTLYYAFENTYLDMIITYKVDSNHQIYNIENINNLRITQRPYYKNDSRIGSVYISEKTKLIDFSEAYYTWSTSISGKVCAMQKDELIDGEEYWCIYGGEQYPDNTYSFVIFLSANPSITTSAPLAVVKSIAREVNPSDQIVYPTVTAYENGEEISLYINGDCELTNGDVFVYSKDDNKIVEEYYILYRSCDMQSLNDLGYMAGMYAPVDGYNYKYNTNLDMGIMGVPDSWMNLERTRNIPRIGYGIVTDILDSSVIIAKMNSDGRSSSFDEIELAENVTVTVYDHNKAMKKAVATGTLEDLVCEILPTEFSAYGIYDWSGAGREVLNNIFYKTLDGKICDIMFVKAYKEYDTALHQGVGIVDKIQFSDGIAQLCFIETFGELGTVREFYAKASEYTVIDADNNKCSFDDILPYDVLTVRQNGWGDNEIVINRKTIEGTVESISINSDGANEYKIGEKTYKFVDNAGEGRIFVGDKGTFYLDCDGNIAGFEADLDYAVVNKVWHDSEGGKYYIRISTEDGTLKDYALQTKEEFDIWNNKISENTGLTFDMVFDKFIITYKINDAGEIYNITPVSELIIIEDNFNKREQKIGLEQMSEKTKVLDFSKVWKIWNSDITENMLGVSSVASFLNGEMYNVIFAGEKLIDGSYPFVVVMEFPSMIKADTPFAVVKSVGEAVNETDETVYSTALILEGSEEKTLYFEEKPSLSKGDVIVYGVNYSGLVDEYYKLFSAKTPLSLSENESYNTKYAPISGYYNSALYLDVNNIALPENWSDIEKSSDRVRIGYGVPVAKNGSDSISIGKVNLGSFGYETSYFEEFEFYVDKTGNTDVNAYIYDQASKNDELSSATIGNLSPTKISLQYIEDDVYLWEDARKTAVNTVFFKTVDDEITDIIMVKPV